MPTDSIFQPDRRPRIAAPLTNKRWCPKYLQTARLTGGGLIAFNNCGGIRKSERSPWVLCYLTQAIANIRLSDSCLLPKLKPTALSCPHVLRAPTFARPPTYGHPIGEIEFRQGVRRPHVDRSARHSRAGRSISRHMYAALIGLFPNGMLYISLMIARTFNGRHRKADPTASLDFRNSHDCEGMDNALPTENQKSTGSAIPNLPPASKATLTRSTIQSGSGWA